MYKIEKRIWGVKLEFSGFIDKEEMQKWHDESLVFLKKITRPKFGVFVDMRNLKPLPADAKAIMEAGQKAYKEKGMERSVVIVQNVVTASQFRAIAQQSGIDAFERYIAADRDPNWEKDGENWINRAVDPDKIAA